MTICEISSWIYILEEFLKSQHFVQDSTSLHASDPCRERRRAAYVRAFILMPCKLLRNPISFWMPAHDTSRPFPGRICTNARNTVDIDVARLVMHERGTRLPMRKYSGANRSPLAQTEYKKREDTK